MGVSTSSPREFHFPIPTKVCIRCRKSFGCKFYIPIDKTNGDHNLNTRKCPHCGEKLGAVIGKKIPKRTNVKELNKLKEYVRYDLNELK